MKPDDVELLSAAHPKPELGFDEPGPDWVERQIEKCHEDIAQPGFAVDLWEGLKCAYGLRYEDGREEFADFVEEKIKLKLSSVRRG